MSSVRITESIELGFTTSRSTDRSGVEIRQELAPTIAKVDSAMKKMLSWPSIFSGVGKKIGKDVVKKPLTVAFKIAGLAGVGFLSSVLLVGAFAGFSLHFTMKQSELTSSNAAAKLNAGLNYTNADQAAQFIIDFMIMMYGSYQLVTKKAYFEFMVETLNKAYNPALLDLLQIKQENAHDEVLCTKLKEDMNFLYKDLLKYVNFYEGVSNFEQFLSEYQEKQAEV